MEALEQAKGLLSSASEKATEIVTGQKPPPEPSVIGNIEEQFGSCCPALTKTQRLYGAVSCMVLGAFVSFLSTITFWGGTIL
jgi:hypothetical protein